MNLKINVKEISLFRVLVLLVTFTLLCSYIYFFIAKDYQIFISEACDSGKCFINTDEEEYLFIVKSGISVENCKDEECLVQSCDEQTSDCFKLDCSSSKSNILSGYFCKK